VLVVESEPVPDVHEGAEAHAEDEAEDRERDAAPDHSCRERGGDTACTPGEHLPGRPYTLAEEEVRDERCDCTDGESAPRAESRSRNDGDHGHRLHAGDRSEQHATGGRGGGERRDQRHLFRRVRPAFEPGSADGQQREGDEQKRQPVV